MATGVVSGAAALLIEAHPNWTPAQVKGALQATLVDVPGAGGVIDVNAALDANSTATVSLAPNTLIDPTSGLIDWTRASFRRASFRDASGSSAERHLEPGQLPLRLRLHRQRRDRSDPGELPEGELPEDDRLRLVGRWLSSTRARPRGEDLAPHGRGGHGHHARLPRPRRSRSAWGRASWTCRGGSWPPASPPRSAGWCTSTSAAARTRCRSASCRSWRACCSCPPTSWCSPGWSARRWRSPSTARSPPSRRSSTWRSSRSGPAWRCSSSRVSWSCAIRSIRWSGSPSSPPSRPPR